MPARRSRPRRASARAPARASRAEAAWREFAASFTRIGMVPPAEPGLVAVEAAEGSAVLLLEPRQALTFTGKCRLRCLYGAVRLLGFAVASHHPGLPVFSPATHSALSLEALPGARPPAAALRQLRAAARAAMRSHRVRRPARVKVMARFSPDCAVVLLEHLDTPVTRFLLSHPPLSRFFEPQKKEQSNFTPEDAVLASVGIVKCSPDRGLLLSETTCLALEELIQACCAEDESVPVVLVCGPKNTGKSTFNRYLINLLLNRLPVVEYMECDIGQTEFTPPGCVSLSSVTEPILGPPFTHQQMPSKMVYYGQTSCEQDTERYLDVVKYVFSCYKKEVPLVINTMGWVKGEGLLLLIDIIRLLSPSHIVQMDMCDWKAMPPLTPEHVHFSAGLHTKGKQQSKCKQLGVDSMESWKYAEGEDVSAPQHKLLYVHPEFPRAGVAGEVRVHSTILRDMSILGYLGHLQSPDIGAVLPLHSLVPYQVPFNAIALRVIHTDVAPSNIMYAVNASWVGLCCIPEEVRCQSEGPVLLTQTPICDCLGFGIVRGVDMEKKLYHILTPVPPANLRLVNCLLLGNIAIPNCVLVDQHAITLYCAPAAGAMEPEQQLSKGESGFENVELGVIGKKKKVPRRVIHFASGETMEEYSTDEEEDEQEKKDLLPPVDPTTLTWGPYLWFHMLRVATSTLSVCDFLGEKIASVLGISTPKYQYAIDEYYRMKREEEEEEQENKMSEEAERQHQEQQNKPQAEAPVQTDQPGATACSSFVNVNFENEGDCPPTAENKQDVVPVPP